MRSRCLVLAGVFLIGIAPDGMAQHPSAHSPVETVVVTANAAGPAIWHAARGDADVAILGIVEPLPDNFAWNTKPLETILGETRLVLLPAQVRMAVFSGAWFYLTEGDLLHPPAGRTLWDILDPRLAARLARICELLHEPEDEYSNDSAIRAAMRLGSDFRHVYYLTTHEPEDSIAALARAHRVAVRRIASYDLVPSAEDLLELPPAETGRCIDAEIRDIDFYSGHVSAAANAWATGNVGGMMANWAPSNYYQCLVGLSPHAVAIDARSIGDTVQAVEDALAHGGHTLAIVDIGILRRGDGVLDRLKAAGVSIIGP
ncbi:MAG TPA: TraB/GumN family protein [Rhizomicrobium sp.]|nr:TraB/GumN family protein [Rhizomicrobium sp.]